MLAGWPLVTLFTLPIVAGRTRSGILHRLAEYHRAVRHHRRHRLWAGGVRRRHARLRRAHEHAPALRGDSCLARRPQSPRRAAGGAAQRSFGLGAHRWRGRHRRRARLLRPAPAETIFAPAKRRTIRRRSPARVLDVHRLRRVGSCVGRDARPLAQRALGNGARRGRERRGGLRAPARGDALHRRPGRHRRGRQSVHLCAARRAGRAHRLGAGVDRHGRDVVLRSLQRHLQLAHAVRVRARRRAALLGSARLRLATLQEPARRRLGLGRGGAGGCALVGSGGGAFVGCLLADGLLGDGRSQHRRALRLVRHAHRLPAAGAWRGAPRPVEPWPRFDSHQRGRAPVDRDLRRAVRAPAESGGRIHVRRFAHAAGRLLVFRPATPLPRTPRGAL